ncbi:hypothetical protein E3O53_12000 [Cryobacterium sp. TMT2-18-3]|uniref:cell wall-binding repeat-containing protein n=1 Tax=unclassified Cryobacterium TaxID=2649013 RepID=UPI00106B7088|nr:MULTISPECIES: cell wall-binding repeat-containing protein [unclassified Cryobacterium]TFC32003.1 hypothetical protein E3O22_00940 [Cryobacterium sp. TMT2-18-2]TFC62915.1 hypothetical protein E3O53_12000 [Cryobacterium sp. TMT2-18-3]
MGDFMWRLRWARRHAAILVTVVLGVTLIPGGAAFGLGGEQVVSATPLGDGALENDMVMPEDLGLPAASDAPAPNGALEFPTGALAQWSHTVDVAVVMAAGGSGATTMPDDASIRALVTEVGAYWKSQTNGQVASITVNPTIMRFDSAQFCGDVRGLWDEAAVKFGKSTDEYVLSPSSEHLLVFVPNNCPVQAAGTGSIGANWGATGTGNGGGLWLEDNFEYNFPILAHEFGHNLGLWHSNVLHCQDSRIAEGSFGCSDQEYGDVYDIMGSSYSSEGRIPALNSTYKHLLNVTASGEEQAVGLPSGGSSGEITTTLASTGQPSGRRALSITDPQTGSVYSVEFRGGDGFDLDARYATDYGVASRAGIGVRVLTTRGAYSWVLQTFDPSIEGFRRMYLKAGERLSTPSGGVTVSVVSVKDGVATVKVALSTTPSAAPAVDTAAPQLLDFTVTPNVVTAGTGLKKITVTARATDDVSGLVAPVFDLRQDLGDGSTRILGSDSRMSLSSGTPQNGIYQHTVELQTDYLSPGAWEVALRPLTDMAGNVGSSDPLTGFPHTLTVSPPAVPTVSAAPTNVTAIAGNASAVVSWLAPVDDGTPVTSYTVTATPGGATVTTRGELTATFTGLTNGTSYRFSVTADNSIGASAASAPSNAVTPVLPAPVIPEVPIPAVLRLSGADRFAASASISEASFDPGVAVAYIANGLKFPDALSGAPVAGKNNAPVLLVTADGIPATIATELKRLKPKKIVILGGTASVNAAVQKSLQAFASVERLAGADRFDASAAISAENFSEGVPVAYIANGLKFPDALSGAPVAGKNKAPALLVTADSIPASITAELKRLKPKKIVVLGGTASVSAQVQKSLQAFAPVNVPVERLAGADRFDASAAISAKNFTALVPVVYIANGLKFPDALSGAPVAGKNKAPVLLVTADGIPASIVAELKRLKPAKIVVLGGTASVSEAVEKQLAGYIR